MDLETIRWKTVDELLPEEKDFLKENVEQLDEGEKVAFKSFLQEEDTTEESMAEDSNSDAPIEQTPETPPTTPITFASEAERDAWLAQEIAKREASKPAESIKTEEKPDPLDSLRGKKYADPADFYKDLKEVEAKEQQLRQEEQEKINKQFEEEYKQLVVERKLPDPTTDEGKQFRLKLVEFGKKHGKQNYHDSYELYSQLPEQFGGGFKVVDQKKVAADDKEQIRKQKEAATMLNNTAPAESKSKTSPISYRTLHETDIDTLIDM